MYVYSQTNVERARSCAAAGRRRSSDMNFVQAIARRPAYGRAGGCRRRRRERDAGASAPAPPAAAEGGGARC